MAQSVISYQTLKNLLRFEFLDSNEKATIVCPNPQVADDIRDRLGKDQTNFETVTVSFFTKNLFQVYLPEQEIYRKTKLLMELGTLFKGKFPHLPQEQFFSAFNIITDLRSFSVSLEHMEDVLEKMEPDLAEIIKWFLAYMDHQDITDEQSGYKKLSEEIRHNPSLMIENSAPQIVFLGFSHLSASQVDLIGSMAIGRKVFVPIQKEVLKSSKMTDWTKWVEIASNDVVELNEEQLAPEIKFAFFPKDRLSKTLTSYFKEIPTDSPQVVLPVGTPSFSEINEVPLFSTFFKTSSEHFDLILTRVFEDLEQLILNNGDIEKNILGDFILKKANTFKKSKNFRYLKVWLEVFKTFNDWQGLSDINNNFKAFDLRLFQEVIGLNLPRVSSIPLSESIYEGTLRGVDGIFSLNDDKNKVLCVSSNHAAFGSIKDKYSEDILEVISSIGPIQSKDLEVRILKSKLIELIGSPKMTLFIENGLKDENLHWAEIWNAFPNKEEIHIGDSEYEPPGDFLQDMTDVEHYEARMKLSASRMQSYLDCPRKYFFEYIMDVSFFNELDNQLSPAELGTLEHDLIDKYMQANEEFDRNRLEKLCEDSLNELCEKKEVSDLEYHQALSELIQYSENGILELFKLKKIYPKVKFSFEVPLVGERVSGKADCLAQLTENSWALIDFKRSDFSVPSGKQVKELEKIQLWYYSSFLNLGLSDLQFFTYMNLSDPSGSLLFAMDKEIGSFLKEGNFLSGANPQFFKGEPEESFDKFEELFDITIKSLDEEKSFKANPKKPDVCTFCSVKELCDKGAVI